MIETLEQVKEHLSGHHHCVPAFGCLLCRTLRDGHPIPTDQRGQVLSLLGELWEVVNSLRPSPQARRAFFLVKSLLAVLSMPNAVEQTEQTTLSDQRSKRRAK